MRGDPLRERDHRDVDQKVEEAERDDDQRQRRDRQHRLEEPVAGALARARTAYESAPGIYAEDALAWGLYRSGRCQEARTYSARALRLGTRDALLIFHRAMIERCLGSASARSWFRRALTVNPHFSFLWAPVARAELR